MRSPPALSRVLLALLLLVAGPTVAGSERATSPYLADSTRRMADRLEALAAQFEGRRDLDRAKYFRANQPWRIPVHRERLLTEKGPQRILNLRFALARELLWDGRSEEAAVELRRLYAGMAGADDAAPGVRKTKKLLRRWLAVSQLRAGEQRHCVEQHNPDVCIFPVRGGGVHRDPTASRAAIELLSEDLRSSPGDLGARWLLNLASMTLGTWPDEVPDEWLIPPAVFESEYATPRFVDVGGSSGAGLRGLAGGSILEDLDGDGRLDIVASSWGVRDPLRYLRNEGDGTFSDRTASAGLTGEVGGLNLSHADYDNDGHPDLYVLRGGWLGPAGAFPNSLLRNNGDGTFDDVTEEAGVLVSHPSQTAAWADYDGDGWLDLFVGSETTGPSDPHPCQLFHNDGDGTFSDRAVELGLASLGFVKGAAWGDYDNDGRPDLYVSRIGQANLLFHNEGPGAGEGAPAWRFDEVGEVAGVRRPRASFPAWFFDYDNDGWLDLFVAGWDGASIGQVAAKYLGRPVQRAHPRLYRNERDGTFRDVTRETRLDRVLLAMGANFGDIDNDGFLDVYVGTGAPDLETLMPNRMFRNAGGELFQDVTTAGGFGHLQKGHGIAFGDVDNDGDQDVYAVMGGWYTGDVFQNSLFLNPGTPNRFLTLALRGETSNRAGVGARIELVLATEQGERHVHRVVGTGGSFGSSSLQQEIGLGRAKRIVALKVRWPATGETQVFEDVAMDRAFEVREGSDRLRPLERPKVPLGHGSAKHAHGAE